MGKLNGKCICGLATILLGAMFWAAPAAYAAYPDSPIKLIVPWGAGGGMDTMARILEPKVTEALGQPFNYIYKPGAGSAIGTAEVAKAKPDGYTVLFNLYPQQEINVHLGVGSYKPEDLIPVCMIATDYPVIAVLKDSNYKSFQDFVDAAKKKPGSIMIGTTDRSGPVHGAAYLLKEAGVPVNVIPFAAGGPKAVSALLGNQVDALFSTTLPVISMLGEKGRTLVYAAPERSSLFADVPTTVEVGYPSVQGFSGRFFFVPKDTPEPVLEKLSNAFKQACDDPEVHERLTALGVSVQFLDYKQAAAKIKELEPSVDNISDILLRGGK